MPVLLADLANPDHQAAIIDLLDMYSRDEFGDNQPLSDEARKELIPGLVNHGCLARLPRLRRQPAPSASPSASSASPPSAPNPSSTSTTSPSAPKPAAKASAASSSSAVAEDARALGCCKLTLEVRADNLRAQALYKDVGFEPTDPGTWFWTQTLDQETSPKGGAVLGKAPAW